MELNLLKLPSAVLISNGVMGVLCLLTLLCSRKIYFLYFGLLHLVYGAIFVCFPLQSAKLEAGGRGEITGIRLDSWNEFAIQEVGAVIIAIGVLFLVFRTSSDERVNKLLLSTAMQLLICETVSVGFLHVKVAKNVPVVGKDGKMKEPTGLLIKPEVFYIRYALIAVFMVVNLVHYLKSPSPKPQVPARYDTQMDFHRSFITYVVFLIALGMICSPDTLLELFADAKGKVNDLSQFHYQFAGMFLLPQAAFIRDSADFVNKEDQVAVFKSSIFVTLVSVGINTYRAYYISKIPFDLAMLGGMFFLVPYLLNSIIAIIHARKFELDVKESSKKRK